MILRTGRSHAIGQGQVTWDSYGIIMMFLDSYGIIIMKLKFLTCSIIFYHLFQFVYVGNVPSNEAPCSHRRLCFGIIMMLWDCYDVSGLL